MSEIATKSVLETNVVTIRDIVCDGACKHKTGEECAHKTSLVYPYRGAFMRHVGRNETVAEANQVLFFNAAQGYQISHPIEGGDACLDLSIDEAILSELAPADQIESGYEISFRVQRRRIDPRAQAVVALLRHALRSGNVEALEAETLALTLVRRSLGERTSHGATETYGRKKLVDRTKLVLSDGLARRWTLTEIAREVGVSPVYLTQVFQQVEAVPLYRYQLRLRMARALELLGEYDDLTDLALDLGFSSHSHFSASFRKMFGETPAGFQRSARLRGKHTR